MLDWLFVLIFVSAVLFMFFSIEKFKEGDIFWSFIFSLISAVLWYLLAASVLEIEQPYQLYNSSSNQIETGIHIITSKVAPEMVYLFMIPGSIMLVFTVLQVFVAVSNAFKKRKQL